MAILRPRIRTAAAVECLVFLTVALALDWVFFGGLRFRDFTYHPFWLPVLLVTVQYGTDAGLMAAALSTVSLLAGNLPPQAVSDDRFAWLFGVVKLPLMWFCAAVLLGELRRRQIIERDKLRQDLAGAGEREQALAEAYRRLDQAKRALEVRVAGQLRTAVGIYEAAKAIEKLEPAEVLLGVSTLVRSVMNPEKFSVFLLRNGVLELSFSEGWTSSDPFPRVYRPDSPLFREVVARRRLVALPNPDGEAILADAGVIAAPLAAGEAGRVFGMLKVEKLGFLELNFSNVQTLRSLCGWVGAAYANALQYQETRSGSLLNTDTQLFSYSFLSRQLSFLTVLARRVGFDLSMINIRLENRDDLTVSERGEVPLALGRAVSRVLRRSDMAFDCQQTGVEFAVVLPATPAANVQIVADKLTAALNEELAGAAPGARFRLQIHAIYEAPPKPAPVLEHEHV